jgi:hypothetical protein
MSLPALNTMKRADCEAELKYLWGYNSTPVKHTVDMLKDLIRENRNKDFEKKEAMPKLKAHLIAACAKKEIELTGNETNAGLQRKLLAWEQAHGQMQPGTDQTVTSFGKHEGTTFLKVFQNDPSYVVWMIGTIQETDEKNQNPAFAQMGNYFEKKLGQAETQIKSTFNKTALEMAFEWKPKPKNTITTPEEFTISSDSDFEVIATGGYPTQVGSLSPSSTDTLMVPKRKGTSQHEVKDFIRKLTPEMAKAMLEEVMAKAMSTPTPE